MATPSQIPGPGASDAEVADFLALVDRLAASVRRAQLADMVEAPGRRPPPERIGPSETYRELEYLLGYRRPSAYRASPSGPADFDPPRAAGPVA